MTRRYLFEDLATAPEPWSVRYFGAEISLVADSERGYWIRCVHDDDEIGPTRVPQPNLAEVCDVFARLVISQYRVPDDQHSWDPDQEFELVGELADERARATRSARHGRKAEPSGEWFCDSYGQGTGADLALAVGDDAQGDTYLWRETEAGTEWVTFPRYADDAAACLFGSWLQEFLEAKFPDLPSSGR